MSHWPGQTGDYYRPWSRRHDLESHYDGRDRDRYEIEDSKAVRPASSAQSALEKDDSLRQHKEPPRKQPEPPREKDVPIKKPSVQQTTPLMPAGRNFPKPLGKKARKRLRKQQELLAATNKSRLQDELQPVPQKNNDHKNADKKTDQQSEQLDPAYSFDRENLAAMSRRLTKQVEGDAPTKTSTDAATSPTRERPQDTVKVGRIGAEQTAIPPNKQNKHAKDLNIKGLGFRPGEPKKPKKPNKQNKPNAVRHTSVLDLPLDDSTPQGLPGMNLSAVFEKAIAHKQEQRQQDSDSDSLYSSDVEMFDGTVASGPKSGHPMTRDLSQPSQQPSNHRTPPQAHSEGFNIKGQSGALNHKPSQNLARQDDGDDGAPYEHPAFIDSARANTLRLHAKDAAFGGAAYPKSSHTAPTKFIDTSATPFAQERDIWISPSMDATGFKIRSSGGERMHSPTGGPLGLKIRGVTAENNIDSQHQQLQRRRQQPPSPPLFITENQQHGSLNRSEHVAERIHQQPISEFNTRGSIEKLARPLKPTDDEVRLELANSTVRVSKDDGRRVIRPHAAPVTEMQTSPTLTAHFGQPASSSWNPNNFELLRSKAKEIDWRPKYEVGGSLDRKIQYQAPNYRVENGQANPTSERNLASDTSSKVMTSNGNSTIHVSDVVANIPASNPAVQASSLESEEVTETPGPLRDVNSKAQLQNLPHAAQEATGTSMPLPIPIPEEGSVSTVHHPSTPSHHARQAEEIEEWLVNTRYHDIPFRRRKQRLLALEKERSELLKEEEEEQVSSFSSSFHRPPSRAIKQPSFQYSFAQMPTVKQENGSEEPQATTFTTVAEAASAELTSITVQHIFPHITTREAEDILEWLVITRYFDEPYRKRKLRLTALERERVKLLQEEEQEEEERQKGTNYGFGITPMLPMINAPIHMYHPQQHAINPAKARSAPHPHVQSFLHQTQSPLQPQTTPQITQDVPVASTTSVEQSQPQPTISSLQPQEQIQVPPAVKDAPLRNDEQSRFSPPVQSQPDASQKDAAPTIPENPNTPTESTLQSSMPVTPYPNDQTAEPSPAQEPEENPTLINGEDDKPSLKRARSPSVTPSRPVKSLRPNNDAPSLQEPSSSSKPEAPIPPKPTETVIPASEAGDPGKQDADDLSAVKDEATAAAKPPGHGNGERFAFKMPKQTPAVAPRLPPPPRRFPAEEVLSDDKGSPFLGRDMSRPRPAYQPLEIPTAQSLEDTSFNGFSIRGARYRENNAAPSLEHVMRPLSPRPLPTSAALSSYGSSHRNPLDARSNYPLTPLSGRSTMREIVPLNLSPHETSYFILRTQKEAFLNAAKAESIWVTSEKNAARLGRAFKDCRDVVLFFSVLGSKAFQGYARMETPPGVRYIPFPSWAAGGARLADPFRIRWFCTRPLSFRQTGHLTNAYNDNQIIAYAKDGQEVDPETGEKLVLSMDDEL